MQKPVKNEIKLDGMFIAIGVGNSELIKGKITMSEAGYVLTNDSMETNIPGVFAAGDLRQALLQLITAASDGAIAAYSAQKYIIQTFGIVERGTNWGVYLELMV